MSVHYKFKSALEYDTVTFDGLHISVKDLKNAIIQQKRIGKNTDFDLQVTNAQTKEVYEDENALIPKNTSLLIARIPTAAQTKNRQWEGYGGDATPPVKLDEGGPIAKAVDLSSLDAPEDDKIKAMISQSTQDYDPSNYMKIRGANQMGAVPPNYRCYKCHQTGHWIKDCPLSKGPEPIEIKKSTGIPLSFMVPVEGPQVPGAMMTPNGSYAVPALDHQTYTQKQTNPPPLIQEAKPEIPDDLLCSICSDLLTDAVMIPCCGNSFCDECIRNFLLDSEEHECPDCHEKDISPGTLIPNRFLRNSVANFKNTTGYVKKPVYKQREGIKKSPKCEENIPKKIDLDEKTVISEADSTEHSKSELEKAEVKVETVKEVEVDSIPEGPPGVSPEESPKTTQQISKRVNNTSRDKNNTSRQHKSRLRDDSPKRHQRHRSPPYNEGRQEERPGTPTVDEPGIGANPNYPPPDIRQYGGAPPGVIPPMMGAIIPSMQGPPPGYPTGQQTLPPFPPNGPPPNFRLPPPGAAPPFLPPGPYAVPPRHIYDTSRPPMTGPPPMYNPNYPSSSRSHHGRDYGMNDRRMRGRTPSGVIDDPLAAFNRMLREKDERERRKRNRRSYSRSRSRSRSYSRSPRRLRSRSPRRRQSRSRSRSFSISRSRSRSFSGSLRGSPFREFSPRHSPRRRGHSRFRSPIRSPPRHRYKDSHQDRYRERDYERDHEHDRERDYGRDDRGYSRDRDHNRRGESDKHDRDNRDRDYNYYDNYDDRGRNKNWGSSSSIPPPRGDGGFYQNEMTHYSSNRYQQPPREYPTYKNEPLQVPPNQSIHMIQPPQPPPPPLSQQRRFDDIAPPGVEEPPIPGVETDRFDRFNPITTLSSEKFPSPKRDKKCSPSIKRQSKSHDKDLSPDKHKRKRRDSSDKDKKSDDEKSKRNKDRKKKKDKKDSDKKKRKDKKDKHRDKKHKDDEEKIEGNKGDDDEAIKKKDEIEEDEKIVVEQKNDLYDDVLLEGVDAKVVENYGKIDKDEDCFDTKEIIANPEPETDLETYKDEDKDILEIHTNDLDLKTEIDVKNEMLAPLPEKSKWEVEEDVTSQNSPKDPNKYEKIIDKSGKVTNEVLKRAENAIFAKAINAIRPIEIKKISTDRAKLYSGEEEVIEEEIKSGDDNKTEKTTKKLLEQQTQPIRLSVKERLGVKVEDNERVVKVDRNKSRSMSPFSRRGNETNRNYGVNERRVEVVERRRRDDHPPPSRHREVVRRSSPRRDFNRSRNDYRRDRRDRRDNLRRDERRRSRSTGKPKFHHDNDEKKRKRNSRSRSESDDKKRTKKKDKKIKKDKTKKHKDDEENVDDKKVELKAISSNETKRKPTIDEANFEPDYDLESESEKDEKKLEVKKLEEKKSSSSSDTSDSSTDDGKKKKKHKKHRKKRSKKGSSSSSSDSDSESSDDENKKRKKHKKKQKKRKKSKHK